MTNSTNPGGEHPDVPEESEAKSAIPEADMQPVIMDIYAIKFVLPQSQLADAEEAKSAPPRPLRPWPEVWVDVIARFQWALVSLSDVAVTLPDVVGQALRAVGGAFESGGVFIRRIAKGRASADRSEDAKIAAVERAAKQSSPTGPTDQDIAEVQERYEDLKRRLGYKGVQLIMTLGLDGEMIVTAAEPELTPKFVQLAATKLLELSDEARTAGSEGSSGMPGHAGDAPDEPKGIGLLREFGVPANVVKRLHDAGYRSLQEIRKADDIQLMSLKGIGPETLTRIRNALAGLSEL